MFGSHVLETALGLAFIYLVVSAFASAINEAIAGILSLRSKDLEAGLKNMLAQDRQPAPLAAGAAAGAGTSATGGARQATASAGWNLATALLQHPTVQNLSAPQLFGKGVGAPSYLDAKVFSSVLLDLIAPGSGSSFAQVRTSLTNVENEELRRTLLPLIDRADDIDHARKNIEDWFDEAMERLSGRYKRRAQAMLFVLGLALAVGLNIDSVRAIKTLWTDPVVREQLLEQAKKNVQIPTSANEQSTGGAQIGQSAADFEKAYSQMATPLGWSHGPSDWWSEYGQGFSTLLIAVLGWFLTAVAVSFGAPFWFDFLNKTIGLNARLSGAKS